MKVIEEVKDLETEIKKIGKELHAHLIVHEVRELNICLFSGFCEVGKLGF